MWWFRDRGPATSTWFRSAGTRANRGDSVGQVAGCRFAAGKPGSARLRSTFCGRASKLLEHSRLLIGLLAVSAFGAGTPGPPSQERGIPL
jgi:hypothetical protein